MLCSKCGGSILADKEDNCLKCVNCGMIPPSHLTPQLKLDIVNETIARGRGGASQLSAESVKGFVVIQGHPVPVPRRLPTRTLQSWVRDHRTQPHVNQDKLLKEVAILHKMIGERLQVITGLPTGGVK